MKRFYHLVPTVLLCSTCAALAEVADTREAAIAHFKAGYEDFCEPYDDLVDFMLLDSHAAGDKQIGALGITHDWSVSRRLVEAVDTPCILAGGLGPDNVADAIAAVRPAGVDSKTRTDMGDSHKKDPVKIRAFVTNAREAS